MTRSLSGVMLFCFPLLSSAQGLTPEQSLKAMRLPEGFSVQCVAHEPIVRQPVSMSFDERGRLWVLQYLQYPNYEGLKPVKQDQYLRTIWDKIPEPPPKGPKGADRITILWDVGEDGKYRKSKDFVACLNIASGFCLGNGGVYVVQPPYLLFYPDKDKDDVPDGDPEVLLTGFGMDDTHSLANSLQWGPDGWLYGAAGSTSTCKIPNPANPKEVVEFQQGVWRYHPSSKRFELFSEGGGNTYGLDFDRYGRCITGTNFGGKAMLHQMQGAYYVKGFSKHGPLHNPHAYGYFDHVPYEGEFKGGHVTCGGIVYDADLFPKEYHHQYIAANLLSNAVYMHTMTEKGSSFTAKHGADLLVSSDPWFRPVDCLLGPDGCVYVADWYDKRAAHLDPIDNWDKTNGRIYRISYRRAKPVPEMDLGKKTTKELVELLKEPNKWWRNEARRLLGERKDKSALPQIEELLRSNENWSWLLEGLWALNGFDDDVFTENRTNLATRAESHALAWGIRLATDRGNGSISRGNIRYVAKSATDESLLCQWAASLRRVEAKVALPAIHNLLRNSGVPSSNELGMMVWWAVERFAISDRDRVLDIFDGIDREKVWQSRLASEFLIERLARRWMAEGTEADVKACIRLIKNAPSTEYRQHIARGMNDAMKGRKNFKASAELIEFVEQAWSSDLTIDSHSEEWFSFGVRIGDSNFRSILPGSISNPNIKESLRLQAFALAAEITHLESLPAILEQLEIASTDKIQAAALNAAQAFDSPQVTTAILSVFKSSHGPNKARAKQILLARPASAKLLLEQVDSGKLPKTELTPDQLRPLTEFKDAALTKLIEKHYGKIAPATPGEKQARISWLNIQVPKGKADLAKGKELFTKHCAACHQLFGEGGKVGPDLTTADRKNRAYLLTHIVDPSLYIRPEYVSFNVNTLDGRRLSGLVSEQGESVTLTNVVNNVEQKTTVAKKDIEDMKPSPVSLMPEKLFDAISEDDVRNLLGHLQQEPKKEPEPKQPAQPKKDAKKLKVLLVSGSLEYESDQSFEALRKYLEANHPIECLKAFRKADNDLPGLDQLETCDVAVFFTRRLTIDGEQLERVKKYVASGKPVIGIRTASHGFQKYLEMDKEVFGGDYKSHHGNKIECQVAVPESAAGHPVLKGVKAFKTLGSLYKNADIARDCKVLLVGSIDKFSYPVAWTREIKGQRIFYTSLGYQEDFKDENFVKLLANAIEWTTGK